MNRRSGLFQSILPLASHSLHSQHIRGITNFYHNNQLSTFSRNINISTCYSWLTFKVTIRWQQGVRRHFNMQDQTVCHTHNILRCNNVSDWALVWIVLETGHAVRAAWRHGRPHWRLGMACLGQSESRDTGDVAYLVINTSCNVCLYQEQMNWIHRNAFIDSLF